MRKFIVPLFIAAAALAFAGPLRAGTVTFAGTLVDRPR